MLRLILADDEQYEREYLENIIKESYRNLLEIVYEAVDGLDLMEKLEEYKPHIVLLDIKMPRLNGLEAAEKIQKKYPDVQIVIISAYSNFEYAKQALKIGVTDYLLKPYLDSELKETLDKVILRARKREDSLSLLSYSEHGMYSLNFDFYRDLEKDLLWNLFFRRKAPDAMKNDFQLWGIHDGWFKIVLMSSPALVSMGSFSQEVLKNYFQMTAVTVLNNIWMDQMVICLYSAQADAFTELTGCIRRARNYLTEESRIPVVCGVSGTCRGIEELSNAYEEAAAFISEYASSDVCDKFVDMTTGMKQICDLEDQIIMLIAQQDRSKTYDAFVELIEKLEKHLLYQDVSVKLNFARSLMSILRGINRISGIRVKTAEAIAQFEKLRQLNFDGDNLKYHADFFAGIKIQKE